MTQEDKEKMFLDLNSVLVKFWIEQGRPDKEVKIELLERMLDWYKKMGYATLDSQPEEKPSKSLEEAADEYEKNHTYQRYDGGGFTPEYNATLAEAFQAGAQWQKKQDTADMLKSDFTVFNKCYEQGKEDMKEQMLKDAVECELYRDGDFFASIDIDMATLGYTEKDKVKIIIVKEEDEK